MNMKQVIIPVLVVVIFILSPFISFGQNIGINTSGAAANTSAGLDVDFSSKGMLIPRISLLSNTDVATITSPAVSLLVYNSNPAMTNGKGTGFYYWSGSLWEPIVMTSSSGGPCSASMVTNELSAVNGQPCSGAGCTGLAMVTRDCSISCDNLSYNGYTDWRIPSMEELVTLINVAPNNTNTTQLWTSSSVSGSSYPTLVLNDGNAQSVSYFSSVGCRCIR